MPGQGPALLDYTMLAAETQLLLERGLVADESRVVGSGLAREAVLEMVKLARVWGFLLVVTTDLQDLDSVWEMSCHWMMMAASGAQPFLKQPLCHMLRLPKARTSAHMNVQ